MTTKILRAQPLLRKIRLKPMTPLPPRPPRPTRLALLKLDRVCILCGGVPDPGKTMCVNCEDSVLAFTANVRAELAGRLGAV
ncbi:MAG: hypothetical protein KGL39_25960 [Patescibacteria group bacterium]|nr:hypothetical protein [Patescibacteria group bacterium]